MKRAVVTGATGTIGTALIDELIRNDMEVVVICNPDSERNDRIPEDEHIRKLYCPLCRLKSLENTTGKEYDVFYHLAWQGTGGPFRNDIYLQYRNVQYSLDAVGAAKRFGCRTFIGAGSQAEYGRFNGKLKPETPAFPETGYGIGKLSAGLMTREYAHQAGLRHIWVRVLSVYGPNDSSQTMIMSVIKSIREGKTPELTKGEQMWDYLYSSRKREGGTCKELRQYDQRHDGSLSAAWLWKSPLWRQAGDVPVRGYQRHKRGYGMEAIDPVS